MSTEKEEEDYELLLNYLESYTDLLATKGPDSVELVVSELRELILLGDFSTHGLRVSELDASSEV